MKTTIPSSIGFAIIFTAAFFGLQTILYGQAAHLAEFQPQPEAPEVIASAPTMPQTALIENTVAPTTTPAMTPTTTTPTTTPGLLPAVTLNKKVAATAKPAAPVATPPPAAAPKPAPAAPAPKTTASTAVTAQSFIAATTPSFRERWDGPYEMILTTQSGGTAMTWGLDQTTVGGSGGTPQFSVSYSCNPIPILPLPTDADQNPAFNVRTSYDCTIGVTPLSGNDLRTQSRDFTLTTGPGQFIITLPQSLNPVLQSNTDQGGFVFNNEDSQPVTITGLDLDVSYTALYVLDMPLLLRVLDPVTDASLNDYHLENLPTPDPTIPYAHSGTDIQLPISFTVPPKTQKMLPIELLGVNTMNITGVNPTVTITLRNITTDQGTGGGKIVLGPTTQIVWSCIIPIGGYDPNATDSPFATGQACK